MRTLVFVSLALCASVAFAQRQRDLSRQQAAEDQILAAQAEATANAVRPGDESLSCEALQTEMISLAQQMQPSVQGVGAQAAADFTRLQEAQQEAEAQTAQQRRGGRIFGQAVRGMATGMIPGADRANAAAQQAQSIAQAAEAQRQTQENLDRISGLSESVAGLAGPAMRGQRVLELAGARNCAWLQEGGDGPPGAFPPGAGPPPGAVPPGIPAPQQ
jgi:hypothetical protein